MARASAGVDPEKGEEGDEDADPERERDAVRRVLEVKEHLERLAEPAHSPASPGAAGPSRGSGRARRPRAAGGSPGLFSSTAGGPGANSPTTVSGHVPDHGQLAQLVQVARAAPPAGAGSPRRRGARGPARRRPGRARAGRVGSTGTAVASTTADDVAPLAHLAAGRPTARPRGRSRRARGRAPRARGRTASGGCGSSWARRQAVTAARRRLGPDAGGDERRRPRRAARPGRAASGPRPPPPRVPVTTTRSPACAPARRSDALRLAEEGHVHDDRARRSGRRCRRRGSRPSRPPARAGRRRARPRTRG